jgi:hypothetical protein
MDVRPAGLGPAGPAVSRTLAPTAAIQVQASAAWSKPPVTLQDLVAVALRGLSESDLAKLIRIAEQPLPQAATARSDELFQRAVSFAAAGDVTRALAEVAELARQDPRRAESAPSEPALREIRTGVDLLLARLRDVARLDAETRIGRAVAAAEATALAALDDWDAPPQLLLRVATHLAECGGYANYLHAAQLAQLILDQATRVPLGRPAPPRSPLTALRRYWNTTVERVRILWYRAPLLVMLLTWLALGLAGAAVSTLSGISSPGLVELWATGFLALVVFGFYMRVRNVRF